MYKIFIKNLKLFGYHGVNPEEKISSTIIVVLLVSVWLLANRKIKLWK